MNIAKIKFVSETSKNSNPGAGFYMDFLVNVDGINCAGNEVALPGEPGQHKEFVYDLRTPVDINKFSAGSFHFSADAEGGGNPQLGWLPSALTVYGAEANSNDWHYVAGVSRWPDNKWVGVSATPSSTILRDFYLSDIH